MEIKPESNNHKILLELVKANRSLSVKILAEKTKIPYSNIHRSLKKLLDNRFIDRVVSQEGRNRFSYISLTSKGADFKAEMQIEIPKKPTQVAKIRTETQESYLDEISETPIKFGIRFYAWFAGELGIPNYSTLRLSMLKLKIGLHLIEESGLEYL